MKPLAYECHALYSCIILCMQGPKGGNQRGGDRKIFLGGLPNNADENAIRNFFNKYGKVILNLADDNDHNVAL